MKLFLLLLSISNGLSYIEDDVFCSSHTSDNWSCQREKDNSLTVVFDCNKGDVLPENKASAVKRIESKTILWLWSTKLPKSMKTLVVKNCAELGIYAINAYNKYSNDSERQPAVDFKILHVLNVSDLYVERNWFREEFTNYSSGVDIRNCLPDKAIFKDVQNALLEFMLPIVESCSRHELLSLKFVNVKIDLPSNYFYIPLTPIKEFVMDNVEFGNVMRLIAISNKKTVLTVKNSVINIDDENIFNFDGYEVIISNNTFKYFGGTRDFTVKANKIFFEGNTLPAMDDGFCLSANEIKIANNVFHHVFANAFSNIDSSVDTLANISRIFNFSNNIILSIEPGAFNFNSTEPSHAMFDQFIISNNSVKCSCRNMHWFHSMAEIDSNFQNKFLRSRWFQTKNNNKCYDIPNCTIGQVLKNYQSLCDYDFVCLDKFETNNNNPNENSFGNISEIVEKNSRLLQTLIENVKEVSNIYRKSDEAKRNISGSYFFVSDALEKNSLSYDLRVLKNCVVVIACLFCILTFFVLIIKICKLGIIIFGRKRNFVVTETEMKESSVAESCRELD